MINAILLEDFLTKQKLRRISEEIGSIAASLQYKFISILILSDGGDAISAVDFVETMAVVPIKFKIKIYRAGSAAAYIALALSDKREMSRDATLGLHRGEIRLSPTQISPDGKIDENLVKGFKKYDTALIETMGKNGLNGLCASSYFYATDWLRISARECLKRGIVQKLF